jgi:hypothetical protein
MDYLQELRKLVGHRPLLMIGATTLILDGQGRLLLLKRSDSGCWGPELFYRYPNGDEVHNVTIVYRTHVRRGEVRLNGEHIDWRWFAAADIPEDLSPPIRPVIEKIRQESQP